MREKYSTTHAKSDDQVTSNNMLDFCAPYSKMAENFTPKANTIVCMDGEGQFLVRDWGKECVANLTRLKRGCNGFGINSGKEVIIIMHG